MRSWTGWVHSNWAPESKKSTLFAAVQFELALGTCAVRIESGSEDGSAIGTAGAGNGADHARGARAELIGAARPASRRLAVMGLVAFFLLFRVAVPAVSVLSFHKRLRPPVSTDCHSYNSCFCAGALANLACIQSDCYTRPGRRTQSLEVTCRIANVQRAGDGTSMFVALWEFEVKPGSEERFEKGLWPGWRLGTALPERDPL